MAFSGLFKTVVVDLNRMYILTLDWPTVWQRLNWACDELEMSLSIGAVL